MRNASGTAGLLIITFFLALGIALSVLTRQIFFLINFGYIGLGIGLGVFLYGVLPKAKKHIGRMIAQFMVGSYLFVFLGIFAKMNMQIEGVWFDLLYGAATAPLIHYAVAKIAGPLLFGRIYCSWGCWSSMVFNLFPYRRSPGRVRGSWGSLRYLHFFISIAAVLAAWFFFSYNEYLYFPDSNRPAVSAFNAGLSTTWFLIGNAAYYGIGILLVFLLKDNRAFCKYVCPAAVFLKAGSTFSVLKIGGSRERCTGCGACTKACPMDIGIDEYIAAGKRVLSNECVKCLTCTNACPRGNLSITAGLDAGFASVLRFRIEGETVP